MAQKNWYIEKRCKGHARRLYLVVASCGMPKVVGGITSRRELRWYMPYICRIALNDARYARLE